MPEALSTKPQPYKHDWKPGVPYNRIYTGWTYPPKDYDKWRDLVSEWVRHSISRYGKAEVESWYWEVWNEPDIGYWSGTPEEFRKLYDYAADGVKRVLPDGPRRWTAHHRAQRAQGATAAARLPRALPARHQLRDRQDRIAARFRGVPCQGCSTGRRRSRAHGHQQSAARHLERFSDRRVVPRAEEDAHRHRRIRSRRMRRLLDGDQSRERLPQRHDVFELHRGAAGTHV